MSYVLIMLHVNIRSTVSAVRPWNLNTTCPQDLCWVLPQLKSAGSFLPWDTLWEVVLWSGLGFVQSNIPEGTVCVLRVRGCFFFLVKLHILNTAHSDSTVSEEVLSILLCARRELFPLSFQSESRVGGRLAFRCPLMTPCTPIGAFLQRARQTHTETLGLEQWHATPQDVYVISRVCQKLFGVAVETKCNIEPHPRPPLFLPVASPFPEKKLSVRESQASSPTLAAAARLAAMIHGKDRMYSNNMKANPVSFFLSICAADSNASTVSYKWILFCFRWLHLILNVTLQLKRRRALYLATHAGIVSSCLLRSLGPVLRNRIHRHHTVAKREPTVLFRRIGDRHSLVSAPLLPSLPPRLFLPPHGLLLIACLREHRDIKLHRVDQFPLLCLAEDAVLQRRAGAWGKTQFSVKFLLSREEMFYIST